METFIATTNLNAVDLSPRAAKLLSFIQEKANYNAGVFFWSKAKTCEALNISQSTYARALRELRDKNYVEIRSSYRANGSQSVNVITIRHTGYHYVCDTDATHELKNGALKVYLQICRQCGKGSYAISRRSLARKCSLSMSSITRIIRYLRGKGFIRVTAENRMHIFGNPGQTYNRFRILRSSQRRIRRTRFLLLFAAFTRSPLIMCDTPQNYSPIGINSKEKKTKSSLLTKLKEIAGTLRKKFRQWQRLRKTVLPF